MDEKPKKKTESTLPPAHVPSSQLDQSTRRPHAKIAKIKKKSTPEKEKSATWYVKTHTDNRSESLALEATASDFFRFILGPTRAAKSRVAYAPSRGGSETPVVISKTNKSDYESIVEDFPEKMKAQFTEKSHLEEIKSSIQQDFPTAIFKDRPDGTLEVSANPSTSIPKAQLAEIQSSLDFMFDTNKIKQSLSGGSEGAATILSLYLSTGEKNVFEFVMAAVFLAEEDANPANFGLNENDQFSKIDYDWALMPVKKSLPLPSKGWNNFSDVFSSFQMGVLFKEAEKTLPANSEAREQFYRSTLLMLILGNPAINQAITSLHTFDPKIIQFTANFLTKQSQELWIVAKESPEFKAYVANFDLATIFDDMGKIFSYYRKNEPEEWQEINNNLQASLVNISTKLSAPPTANVQLYSPPKPETTSRSNTSAIKVEPVITALHSTSSAQPVNTTSTTTQTAQESSKYSPPLYPQNAPLIPAKIYPPIYEEFFTGDKTMREKVISFFEDYCSTKYRSNPAHFFRTAFRTPEHVTAANTLIKQFSEDITSNSTEDIQNALQTTRDTIIKNLTLNKKDPNDSHLVRRLEFALKKLSESLEEQPTVESIYQKKT